MVIRFKGLSLQNYMGTFWNHNYKKPWEQMSWMVIQTSGTKEHYGSFTYGATCDLFQKSLPEKIVIFFLAFAVLPVSRRRLKTTQVLFRNEKKATKQIQLYVKEIPRHFKSSKLAVGARINEYRCKTIFWQIQQFHTWKGHRRDSQLSNTCHKCLSKWYLSWLILEHIK